MALPAIFGAIARGGAVRTFGSYAGRNAAANGSIMNQAPQFDYSVKDNIRDVVRDLGAVNDLVIDKAIVRTLNRVITSCKGAGVKAMAKDMGLKQKTIRPKLTLHKASRFQQEAQIVPARKWFRLVHFDAVQTAAGVSANAWGARKIYPGTFLANVAAGAGRTEGVFVRKTAERLPIRQLYGPGISQTFARPHILKVLENKADERFEKEMEANLRFYMNKQRARGGRA